MSKPRQQDTKKVTVSGNVELEGGKWVYWGSAETAMMVFHGDKPKPKEA